MQQPTCWWFFVQLTEQLMQFLAIYDLSLQFYNKRTKLNLLCFFTIIYGFKFMCDTCQTISWRLKNWLSHENNTFDKKKMYYSINLCILWWSREYDGETIVKRIIWAIQKLKCWLGKNSLSQAPNYSIYFSFSKCSSLEEKTEGRLLMFEKPIKVK